MGRRLDIRRVGIGVALAVVGLVSLFDLRSYTLLVLVIAAGCLHELAGLVERKGESIVLPVAYVGMAAYLVLAANGRLLYDEGTLLALTTVTAFAWATLGARSGYLARVGGTLLAVLYVGKLLSYIIAIRRLPSGEVLSLFMVIVIAFTDIFAMIIGCSIGRHRLTSISPGKTIEGALGGLLVAVVGGTIFAHAGPLHWPLIPAIFVSLATSIAAQLGDIVESALKRDARVKDAGTVFEAHGGVLDRFDSYVFGGITFYAALFVTEHLTVIGGS